MIDFSESRQNAKLLIERFIESGDQPNFMEYLCFRECYVDGEFFGYGAEYVIKNFQIYVGIFDVTVDDDSVGSKLRKVSNCYYPCKGEDFICEAIKQGVDFTMKAGKLHLIKTARENNEIDTNAYNYYTRRASRLAS